MDIKHLVTSPYHPICNRLVESFNGTLKQMLYKLCKEQPYEWNKLNDLLLFAYRELPNEATGFFPFELIYGRNVIGLVQILHELWTEDEEQGDIRSTYGYVINLRDKLDATVKIAQDNITRAL